MHPDWRNFLAARDAHCGPDGSVRPVASPRADGASATLYDLSHLGLIAAHGADAETFLQGQLTVDIRTLAADRSQLAGYCSPKGRMLASFRIWRLGETIVLELPRERLPEILKRLGMYVLRARVRLEDLSDAWVRIGLAGAGAAAALEALGLRLPEAPDGLAQSEGTTVLRLPAPVPRYALMGEVARIAPLWDALAPVCDAGDADGWALLDIRAGLPSIYNATADAFVPQMANMQLIDGLSLGKGCYTGQEVVARMQYLGKLKRRMYWGTLASAARPQPGDELWAPGSSSEQGAGRIVDARPAGEGRYELLAVAEIAAADGGEVRLGPDGPPLELRPPPYGFPAAPA